MSGLWSRALRGLYRRLVPERSKNSLRLRLLFEERDKPPVEITELEDGPVLVLAPHMDDEVVGCGGAIRLHVLAGAPVTVVFLTDGGFADGPGRAPGSGAVSRRRAEESRRASEVLGTQELVFLDGPDGALEPTPEIVEGLGRVLERTRPAVIYVPSVLDTHLDHWAANLILLQALPRLEGAAPVLRQYEVWTPLLANRFVDIEGVLADKLEALRRFESQLPELDLVQMSEGLARYRSIDQPGHRGRGHVEAFYESGPETYRELLERFRAQP